MGIYMDNAATTMQKPDCVIDAVVNAIPGCLQADLRNKRNALGAF